MDEEVRDSVAGVFKGAAHPARLELLEGIVEGRSLQSIGEEVGISYGSIQNHVEILEREGLILSAEGGRGYEVTPVGEYILEVVERDGRSLSVAVTELAAAEEQARQQRREALRDAAAELDIHEDAG